MPAKARATGHQPVEPDKGPEQPPVDAPITPQHRHPQPDDDDFDDAD